MSGRHDPASSESDQPDSAMVRATSPRPPTRQRIWAGMSKFALTFAVAFGLSACFLADRAPSGIDLLNDTERTLWIDDDPANDHSMRFPTEPEDWSSVSTDECTDRRVEAQTKSGRAVAVLDQMWCPGQVWRITGQGEFVLIEDSP
jgi:hypothetical protein